MGEFFLKIVNMSISAGWVVLAVVVLRLLLKKAPKWMNVLLWGVVGLRLVMPFSLESIFSLIPSTQTITKVPDAPRPYFQSGVTVVDDQVNEYLQGNYFEGVSRPAGHFVDITTILAMVWLVGVAILVLYSIFSYWRVKRKVATAVLLRDNIFQSENVGSPFVLGVFKPKIYLPFAISEQDREQVIAHERAHIRRKDYLWKPLGFFLLSLHWFNPLVWISYVLLCRDIELACDEKVIKDLDAPQKAAYSQALLNCSVHRRLIAACPLAFGEVSVKDRVKSVLHYKKPAFWLIVTAVVVSVAVGFCFLTNPTTMKLQDIEGYGIHERVGQTTSVMVGNGEGYRSVGSLGNEVLQPLFDLKISAKEISNDRSWERDDTNTLILHIPDKDRPWASYIPGIAIHFNEDFTAVWANDSKGEGHFTLSYQVKNPEKAKEAYETIANYNSSTTTVGGADGPQNVTVSDSKAIVTYRVVEEDELGNYQNGIHYYDTEVPNTPLWHIVLEFTEDIREFCFFELDESEVLRKGNTLFELKAIPENQPVLLHTHVNDITRNRGISFQDAKGNFHDYAFTCDLSGKDQLLQLEDILNSSPATNTKELLTAVLENRMMFLPEVGEPWGACYLKDYKMHDPVVIDLKEYAFVDLDQDGNTELVVNISENNGFALVLHCNNDQVYGHIFSLRALNFLKTDGTFVGSGGAGTNYYSRMVFENNQPEIIDEAVDDDLSHEYKINGQTVTKKEMEQFTKNWHNKQGVQWFPYGGNQSSGNTENPYALVSIDEDKITVSGTMKTFREAGVSFQFPSEWDALQQQGEDGRTCSFRDPALGEQCQLLFSVTGSEYQNNRTKSEYLEYLSGIYEDVKISSFKQELLSGCEGTKIVATYVEENQTFVRVAYDNVVAGVRMYDFTITYPESQKETYEDIFNSILQSVTITE